MIEHLPGIPGFSTAPHTHLGETREVYRRGHGPAVIVMSEIPGITPQVAGFATKVADAGFSVWMPQLFGTPLRPISAGYLAQSLAKICIGREFSVLTTHLIDEAGQPTRAALDRTLAFLREQLVR